MSKYPKQRRRYHFQPYQASSSNANNADATSLDFGDADLAMPLDPMLSGFPAMARPPWEDWSDSDTSAGKYDFFADPDGMGLHGPPGPRQYGGAPTGNANGNMTAGSSTFEAMHVDGGHAQYAANAVRPGDYLSSQQQQRQQQQQQQPQRIPPSDLAALLEDDTNELLMDGKSSTAGMGSNATTTMSMEEASRALGSNMMTSWPTSGTGPIDAEPPVLPPPVPEECPTIRAVAEVVGNTMMAGPSVQKEALSSVASTSGASTSTSTTISPFGAYSSLMAMQNKNNGNASTKTKSNGEASSETESGTEHGAANAAFASQGMMMPGFMMYPMPMMGNYGGMGVMHMGMPMNGMTMPMGMNPMAVNPMGMPLPLGMQMNMMGAMGMPLAPVPMAAAGAAESDYAKSNGTAKDAKGSGGVGFVNIARKPDEPEVSSILKSLMVEKARKKEKKLERNRDSARESRRKQQTYVETLENGIKRLQLNREMVLTYRWGVTGPDERTFTNVHAMREWRQCVGVVTGAHESLATLQNPASFETLMRLNRQRRALSLTCADKERAVLKCFVCLGRTLAMLRQRILELQVLRNFETNPLAKELKATLQLTDEQQRQLAHQAEQAFRENVLGMVKVFKAFFALRLHARHITFLSPSLERAMREACSLEQLQRLLQWSETQRHAIEGTLPWDE